MSTVNPRYPAELQSWVEQILEGGRDRVEMLDREGRVLFMGPGGVRALGLRDPSVRLRRYWPQFWEGESRPAAEQALQDAAAGSLGAFVGRDGGASGEELWWDVVLTPLRGRDGSIERLVAVSRNVTSELLQRRAAEAELEYQLELMRTITDNATTGLIMTDLHGRVTFWNPSVEEMTGYPRSEAAGMRVCEVLRELDDAGAEVAPEGCRLMRALAEGVEVVEQEGVVVRKDGRRFPGRWTARPISRDGGTVGLVVEVRDVSAEQESKRALRIKTREAEEARAAAERERSRLAAIMEAVPAVVWIAHDPECRVITGSRASYEFLRLPYGENSSKSAPDAPLAHFKVFKDGVALAPDELPIQLAAKGHEVREFEEEVRFDDGSSRFLLGNATPLRDADGRVTGAVGAFVDITAHKEARAEVQRLLMSERLANERLAFLSRASAVLASTLDLELTLRNVARLALPFLADHCAIDLLTEDGDLEQVAFATVDTERQEQLEELRRTHLGRPLTAWRLPDVLASGKAELHAEITPEYLEEIARAPRLAELQRALGTRSMIIVPLTARGRVIGAMTFIRGEASGRTYGPADLELTQELAQRAAVAVDNARLYQEAQGLNRELESRVAKRTGQLEASNAELEAFAYSVSHDLRAPLRAIDGFSNALLIDNGEQLDDVGRSYLDRIRGAASRMGELIDAMLSLSRLSRSQMRHEPVDLSAIVERLLRGLREEDPVRRVEARVTPGLVVVGDEHLLTVALDNLLENAWKFTREREVAEIEFGVRREGGERVFYLRDNGAGFDPQYAGKLFVAFQRLHSPTRFEGTGVGLTTVQRVIHRHGGRIWGEGSPGAGATFYFTLDERDAARPGPTY